MSDRDRLAEIPGVQVQGGGDDGPGGAYVPHAPWFWEPGDCGAWCQGFGETDGPAVWGEPQPSGLCGQMGPWAEDSSGCRAVDGWEDWRQGAEDGAAGAAGEDEEAD